MTLSFRTRILLLVLVVAILPLGLIGLWLTGAVSRSGTALLEDRLQRALNAEAEAIELSWIGYRTALLDFSERDDIRQLLAAATPASQPPADAELTRWVDSLDLAIEGLVLRDSTGTVLWRWGRTEGDGGSFPAFGALLGVQVPLHATVSGERLGTLVSLVPLNALRSPSAAAAALGAVITAREPESGALLLPAPFDLDALDRDRFTWNGEEWLAARRPIPEPQLTLVALAPLAPFAAPFRRAAAQGTAILLVTTALGIGVAWLLTTRLTRSLERLAEGAGDVARGRLGHRVPVTTRDEVGRVAEAFNAMSESLRRTLDQLAERESLSAVNEFAAALAHEVRNPLTAIGITLQSVEEQLPEDSPLRSQQAAALDDVRRLDRTVAGALATARAGHIVTAEVDLREPARAAVRAAAPAIAEARATLDWREPDQPVWVAGDADALEHVILNLLRNAADAVDADGRVTMAIECDAIAATLLVSDDGDGVPEEVAARVFEPFFTTRPGGTGVGLAVTRRIVTAHRGEITFASEPGRGTTVRVTLPRIAPTGTIRT